jgi:hypothetical protein
LARPDFRAAFREHPVPQLLDDLGEFAADVKGGSFSGRFKLAAGDAAEWLGDAARASDFAVFGHDADGSLYAYWFYDGRTPADAPIVYLNVGHSGSTVLADSLEDFLTLLAHDVVDLGMYFDEAARPRKHSAGNQAFKTWLSECFDLAPATHPERVVKKAAASHPKLSERYGRRGA